VAFVAADADPLAAVVRARSVSPPKAGVCAKSITPASPVPEVAARVERRPHRDRRQVVGEEDLGAQLAPGASAGLVEDGLAAVLHRLRRDEETLGESGCVDPLGDERRDLADHLGKSRSRRPEEANGASHADADLAGMKRR